MSIEKVRIYFQQFNRENDIIELDQSSATVELAAKALGVEPARIAKTLSFKVNDKCILVVTAGDTHISNRKYRDYFGTKAKMLKGEEVVEYTGHNIGGVCPFAVPENVTTYCDISLQRFETIYPACGSSNSAIELTCDELATYANNSAWIDICNDL